ncbi:hypothetical protein GCM10009712_25890 [Pseudarthrobacter sulfonivorans]
MHRAGTGQHPEFGDAERLLDGGQDWARPIPHGTLGRKAQDLNHDLLFAVDLGNAHGAGQSFNDARREAVNSHSPPVDHRISRLPTNFDLTDRPYRRENFDTNS